MRSLEEHILSLLKQAPARLLGFRHLISELDADASERHEIRQVLHGMVKQGLVVKLKGNRYALPDDRSVIVGKLSTHRDGYGFVTPQQKSSRFSGDVFIPARFRNDAMEGDTVLVSVERIKDDDRAEGKILRILQHRNQTIVGQFKVSRPFNYVVPFDSRLQEDVWIREGDELNAPHDSIVNVEVTQFPTSGRSLRGRVIEVLGFRGDFGIDVEIIIRKHQIPSKFPGAVLAEAQQCSSEVGEADLGGRMDFRSLPIVTIDGETAKDFDDAVHVEELGNGRFLLGVHIADVAHYVKPDSAIDREAFQRGTSVYFPDRAVPMLPEELSNGICSLKPKVDRLTLSALMEIDHTGNVQRYSFHKGVIRSQERMTYTSVAKILLDRDPEQCERYRELVPHFERMKTLALLLNERRSRLGSIDFDLPEPIIEFDEFGAMVGILKSERNVAHRIIEEFMLTANETVARHLFQRSASLYRIHESPDPLKVLEFNEIAAGFGYSLGVGTTEGGTVAKPRFKDRSHPRHQRRSGRFRQEMERIQAMGVTVEPKDYQKLAEQISGKPEERILSYLMLRSLKQACYSPLNKGHFGLASSCYTHFTSPIRRYPDLIVHRVLRHQSGWDRDTGSCAPREAYASEKVLRLSFPGPASPFRKEAVRGPRSEQARPDRDVGDPGSKRSLYDHEALETMAARSSDMERRADEAERELIDLKKLEFMRDKLGEEFDGIVIHITREGLYVELLDLFVEGIVKISSLDDDDYQFRDRPVSLQGRSSGRVYRLGDRLRLCVDRIDRFRNRVDLSVVERLAASPPH
ncbi:MAG: VacB/RNase II family 3'-5' exoribonuclease [Acidobacteriota bacterium]